MWLYRNFPPAVGFVSHGPGPWPVHSNWTKDLLRRAGRRFDGLRDDRLA